MNQIIRKIESQLSKPALKREVGGHGDFNTFLLLCNRVSESFDLFTVELPQEIKCSTCRFLTPEFHPNMACWDCVLQRDFPKWRPRIKESI